LSIKLIQKLLFTDLATAGLQTYQQEQREKMLPSKSEKTLFSATPPMTKTPPTEKFSAPKTEDLPPNPPERKRKEVAEEPVAARTTSDESAKEMPYEDTPFDHKEVEEIQAALEAFAIQQSEAEAEQHALNAQVGGNLASTGGNGSSAQEPEVIPKKLNKMADRLEMDENTTVEIKQDYLHKRIEFLETKMVELEAENTQLSKICITVQEKYVNVAKRFHYIEDKMKRRDVDRLTTEKSILTTLEKLQEALTKKDDKISALEGAITECEIRRLHSEEKMLDYFRFEGHIHKQRTTNMKKFFNDFDMSKEALMISDESHLTAEILDLRNTQKEQMEKLDMVKLCQICIEPFDNTQRPRMGLSTCGHSFCSECIENVINTSPFAVSGTGSCPTCQAHFSRHQIFKVHSNVTTLPRNTSNPNT